MYKKLLFASLCLSFLQAADIEGHLRTGIHLTQGKATLNHIDGISFGLASPLPSITAEVQKSVLPRISIGLSGTYIPIWLNSENVYYSADIAMSSYLHITPANFLGCSIHIQHIPLHEQFIGFQNNVHLGLTLRNDITENVYAHFEVQHDITPDSLKSWEIPQNQYSAELCLLSASTSIRSYSSSISIGYILPQE